MPIVAKGFKTLTGVRSVFCVTMSNPRHTRERTTSRCSCAFRSWLSISIHTFSQRRRPQKPQRFVRNSIGVL